MTLVIHFSESLEPFFGYADGASHSTQNLSSTSWAIFALYSELVSFQGICISRSTKNIAEYSALIELLSDAISFGINLIIIRLDSQLVVLQLTSVYTIRNPTLRLFLSVRILERHFDFIQYKHISRNLNTMTDSLSNQVLDRHLQHI